jgi:hypothetical protein
MNAITLWLLLTLPPNPADTQAVATFRTRDACEQEQVTLFLQGQATRCQAIAVPAPAPRVWGPVQ